MNSRDYWTKRVLNARQKASKNADQYETALHSRLQDLSKALEKEFKVYIARYAKANNITFQQAAKYFTKPESGLFSMSLKEFETKAKTGGFKRELDSEYYKLRISRLKALRAQLADVAAQYAGLEEDKFSEKLARQYSQTYLTSAHTAHNAGLGFSVDYARFNERQLKNVVYQPWAGSDFSKRIWRNYTELLPELLTDVALKSTFFGWSYQKAAQEFSKRVAGFEKKNLHRLIRTELGHIQEQATLDFYHDAKQEKYQFLAALESRTCEQCRALDMKVFDVDKAVVSENYPLIHPYCRCTTIPAQDVPLAERWYRDPVTGRGKWARNPNGKGGGMSFLDFKKTLGLTFNPKKYLQAPRPKPARPVVKSPAQLTQALRDLGIKAKGLEGLQPETYQEIYNAFDETLADYPQLKGYIQIVKGGNRPKKFDCAFFKADLENITGRRSYGSKFYNASFMSINKAFFAKQSNLDRVEKLVESHWWVKINGPTDIIRHELGHALIGAINMRNLVGNYDSVIDYSRAVTLAHIWNRHETEQKIIENTFRRIGKTNVEKKDIEKYISRYAKTSYAEAFAELFADRRERAFNRIFKEELEKVIKETFKK